MSDQEISLKTINDLRLDDNKEPQRFFIAAYQRGYRWSPLQVTQLLDDIWEFTKRRDPQPEEFYCLQPLVLKSIQDGGFEVVDGQQRLTTLLLILRHFNERLAEKYQLQLYTLDYETRKNLMEFLILPTKELAESNVDFFYLWKAIEVIEQWFSERESDVEEIKTALLNKTKVIWFQLADVENPVEAFTRLNVGKIPLTNDELIRALFLRRNNADENETQSLQLQIAYEWDQLEKALQEDAFWYFLNNQSGNLQNRIGFLFDLVARAEGLPPEAVHDTYGIFYVFSQKLRVQGASPKQEWRKIKQAFLMLEEWFEDRTLFHIVGFLVAEGMGINAIRELSGQCTKSEFEDRLRQEIFAKVIGGQITGDTDKQSVRERVSERLESLEYGPHRAKIRSLLLLFNLATLLQNSRSNIRFQFDSFKSEKWDIEHVRSVTTVKLERHSDRVAWFGPVLSYFKSYKSQKIEEQQLQDEINKEIETFVKLSQSEATNEIFDPLYAKVLACFGENVGEEADHGIANLALLDQHTNRSYKNAVFAIKRKRILELDQAGIFVPLCTRNVFLKCYSPKANNVLFWSEQDRDAYQQAIIETLVIFFVGKMEDSE
jgi:hypothetical protein